MLLNRILLFICLVSCFISYRSISAPVSDGMCILLKHQVKQFSHAKQSRSYRKAKRAYDKGCYRPKVNKSSKQSVTNTAKTIKERPAEIKPLKVPLVEAITEGVSPVELVPVEVHPIELEAVPAEAKVLSIPDEVKKINNKAKILPLMIKLACYMLI